MARVMIVYGPSEEDRAAAAHLAARVEAGGNEVDQSGALDLIDYMFVLWSKTSVLSAPIVTDARLALDQDKLIQLLLGGLPASEIPSAFRHLKHFPLSGVSTPMTEEMLKAGLALQPVSSNAMYALRSVSSPPGAAIGFVDTPRAPSGGRHSPPNPPASGNKHALTFAEILQLDAHYFAQGANYASGAGALVQFNAIITGLNGALLTQSMPRQLKLAVFGALVLHIVAAFVLCYALRPTGKKLKPQELLDDTIRNYKRGWRATVIAMTVSAAALVWFAVSETELRHLIRF